MSVLQVERADAIVDCCREFVKNYSGNNFPADAAMFLSKQLNVSYVLIGRLLEDDSNKIRTITLLAKGHIVDDMTYSLYGTPCENVVGRNCCYFPSNVKALFPEDKELQDLDIESYIGSPLFTSSGAPLGLIVLMNETLIQHAASAEKALNLIARRIERELSNAPVAA